MIRRMVLAGFASLVALTSTSSARAEVHVDFLFGGHGHGHGHHHHHHHGWYGGFYWPRPVYYYAPPPVTYVPVAPMVQAVPAVSSYGAAAPTAAPSAAPTLPTSTTLQSNALPTYQGRGISIRNPTETGTAVTFVVDSRREAELSPGESHSLAEKSSYVIEFDRGGDFGTARHVVNEGSYEFVATDRGWDLRRLSTESGGAAGATVRRNTLPTQR